MRRTYLLPSLLILMISAIRVQATTYAVKAAGGDYTTIQSCASAMAAGDTCTVYAGTYNEVVTLTAGTAGNYKTLNVNTGDTVNVYGFVMASHTKVSGFTITNPSNPAANLCVSIPTSTTDAYVTNNTMFSCGAGTYMIATSENATGATYIYITGNRMSFGCGTSAAPNPCKVISVSGDHWIIDNNEMFRTADGITVFGTYIVIRGNYYHTILPECKTHGSNCHIDFIESEPDLGSGDHASSHLLIEGNKELRNFGQQAHGILTQGDACSGQCGYSIERYNQFLKMSSETGGGYGTLDDLAGYPYVKVYNSTFAFTGSPNDDTDTFGSTSTNGAEINNIFYYGSSITSISPYEAVGGASNGFTYANNEGFCAGTCTLHGHSGSNSWTSDTGNFQSDPLFNNISGDDYSLQSGSPARGAGTYLTTTTNTGSVSTSLTVADAAFFWDGAGGLTSADWIRIGSSTTVQIASITYSSNIITLATPVSWSSGTGVYLYKDSRGNVVLSGANPDLGAFPSGVTQPPPPPPPTTSVNPPTNLQAIVH
jgi:hypothetical protein